MTRRALALHSGGGNAIALYVETGKQLPTVATLARLASALGVTAPWLAYGIGEQTSDAPPTTCDGMGIRLQTVRAERGLTKAAVARLVDLSPSTVADIENGGQSGVEVIEALADALGVSPAWLAFNQGPQVLPSRRGGRPRSQPADPA